MPSTKKTRGYAIVDGVRIIPRSLAIPKPLKDQQQVMAELRSRVRGEITVLNLLVEELNLSRAITRVIDQQGNTRIVGLIKIDWMMVELGNQNATHT